MKFMLKSSAAAVILVLPFAGLAQTSLTTDSTGDAFLDANKPTANFGKAGTLAIAPTTSSGGAIDTVMRFNLSSVDSQFNTTYGAGTGLLPASPCRSPATSARPTPIRAMLCSPWSAEEILALIGFRMTVGWKAPATAWARAIPSAAP